MVCKMSVERSSLGRSRASSYFPLLFRLGEDTHQRAFIYAALVVGVTTALTLEYRMLDPLSVYGILKDSPKDASTANILHTALASSLITYSVLWLLRLLFGLGDSWVVK